MCVCVCTDGAYVGVLALVDVLAVVGEAVPAAAGRALARERAHGVDALAALAQAGHGQALVHVLALARAQVAQVAGRAVQLGAALAGVSPGHAHGGAAQLLGAHHALQRARAQRAARVRVARPCTRCTNAMQSFEPYVLIYLKKTSGT